MKKAGPIKLYPDSVGAARKALDYLKNNYSFTLTNL